MHLLLTDRLTCPRCGPTFGLILLADRMDGRHVIEGWLGCPNCRDRFRVSGGFADLRAPPRDALEAGLAGPPGEGAADTAEEAGRLAALLGVTGGPGTIALVGAPALHGPALAAALEGVQVVGIDPDLSTWPESPGFSRLVSRPGIPFFDRVLRGVVVDGRLGAGWLVEAARVVAPLSRVVVTNAAEETAPKLQQLGLSVLAADAETVVAARS